MEEQHTDDNVKKQPSNWDLNDIDNYRELNSNPISTNTPSTNTSFSTSSSRFYFRHTTVGVAVTLITAILAKSAVDGNIAIALMTMGTIVYIPWMAGMYTFAAFIWELIKYTSRPD
jgi:hypothetical protein